jgi:hypothetical protein
MEKAVAEDSLESPEKRTTTKDDDEYEDDWDMAYGLKPFTQPHQGSLNANKRQLEAYPTLVSGVSSTLSRIPPGRSESLPSNIHR